MMNKPISFFLLIVRGGQGQDLCQTFGDICSWNRQHSCSTGQILQTTLELGLDVYVTEQEIPQVQTPLLAQDDDSCRRGAGQ